VVLVRGRESKGPTVDATDVQHKLVVVAVVDDDAAGGGGVAAGP